MPVLLKYLCYAKAWDNQVLAKLVVESDSKDEAWWQAVETFRTLGLDVAIVTTPQEITEKQ